MADRYWAVLVRSEATRSIRALGPIYTPETAARVVDAIEGLESEYESALWRSGGSGSMNWQAQAVELESVADFKRELAAIIAKENTHA